MALDSPVTFSAAFTGDVHFAADDLQRRFPGAPLLLVNPLRCSPCSLYGCLLYVMAHALGAHCFAPHAGQLDIELCPVSQLVSQYLW